MSDLDRRSRDEDGDVRLAANFAGSLRDVLEWIRDLTVIVPSDWPPNPLKAAAGLAAGVLRDCPPVGDNLSFCREQSSCARAHDAPARH